MSSGPVEVVLYGRPGCHLCDEARDQITELARAENVRVDLVEIDIQDDPELFRDNLERIPVVLIGGERVSELLLDESAVRRAIARLAGAPQHP